MDSKRPQCLKTFLDHVAKMYHLQKLIIDREGFYQETISSFTYKGTISPTLTTNFFF